jgi:hypothetical protein
MAFCNSMVSIFFSTVAVAPISAILDQVSLDTFTAFFELSGNVIERSSQPRNH